MPTFSKSVMHRERMPTPGSLRHVLACTGCGASSASASERGWRGYRSDDPETDELPTLAFYCPRCATAEYGDRYGPA